LITSSIDVWYVVIVSGTFLDIPCMYCILLWSTPNCTTYSAYSLGNAGISQIHPGTAHYWVPRTASESRSLLACCYMWFTRL